MYWPKFLIKEVEKQYSDSELLLIVAERLGDPDTLNVENDEEERKIYTAISNADGIIDLLRDTMNKDLRRYFAAAGDSERDIIKGGFARTSHWLAKILKINQ